MIKDISELITNNLRLCQNESINTINEYLLKGVKGSCLISLPTGAGKSGVICTVGHFVDFKKILVVTHRKAIRDQLYKQLKGEFFKKILSEDVDYKKFVLKKVFNQINDTENDGIYCATFQKITRLNEIELTSLKNTFDLILIDEGHAEPSVKWGTAIRALKAKKVIITATPYRNDLFSFDINIEHSYIYTYKEAIRDSVIIEPSFEKVEITQLFNKINNIKKSQPDSVCIIKCKEFSDIEKYFAMFSLKYKAIAIHHRYENNLLEHTFHDVPSNLAKLDYEILIHQNKLDEGIDIPKAKILVLSYDVGSGRELVQTVGRVVRKYEDYKPTVFEVKGESNANLWGNYLEFDEYLSNPRSAKRFLNTLNTAVLIDSYLDAFPEYSYFDSGYRKKFNFNDFDPLTSLEIPLASVCFYYKLDNFSLNDCLDKLYWEFNREGALTKYDEDLGVITSVCFNNSKFLKDSLFFEPSLEIMIVKELDNIIAIFDSKGRNFSGRDDLKIGRSIDGERLFTVVSQTNTTRTKQANTRALQSSSNRPEGLLLKGNDLELINHTQSNSTYAVTTAVVSNIDEDEKVASTYYLGVASGRISDQKKKNFPYEKFIKWLDDINTSLKSDRVIKSGFLNSFAQTLDYIPNSPPVACVLDFYDEKYANFEVRYKGYKHKISDSFIYKKYNNGISFFYLYYKENDLPKDKFENRISFEVNDKNVLIARYDENFSFFIDDVEVGSAEIFNNETVKLLFHDGTTFLNGSFYKVKLPTEKNNLNHNIIRSLIPLECLNKQGLSEKDEAGLTSESFGENSIFYLIDQISNVRNRSSKISDFGDFFNHLPSVDLVLCTDMGTEPADFILSSTDKLVFVHVKCGKANSPESSAGAITEVGGQALKNIHYLLSTNPSSYANITNLRGAWPRPNNQQISLNSRIRLFNKSFNLNHTLEEVIATINERKLNPLVRKEIWIVMGNSFSYSHFTTKLENPTKASPETLQAYQLLDTWFSQASNHNVDIKVFVSP